MPGLYDGRLECEHGHFRHWLVSLGDDRRLTDFMMPRHEYSKAKAAVPFAASEIGRWNGSGFLLGTAILPSALIL